MHHNSFNSKLKYHTMMTIAGSDSIGGAGIQADIKTATALGVYAMSTITAVTAQNTSHVASYIAMNGEMVEAQIKTVCSDVMPAAVKTGMIPTGEVAHSIAKSIKHHEIKHLVIDPVAVATSHDRLSEDSAISVIARELFPLAEIITPNISEAALYTGLAPNDIAHDSYKAAEILLSMCPGYVLIKGGDTPNDEMISDILYWKDSCACICHHKFIHPLIKTANTHGTGCSLSSAIASFIAKGLPVFDAVAEAEKWITRAIISGANYELGHGHGPINHMVDIINIPN